MALSKILFPDPLCLMQKLAFFKITAYIVISVKWLVSLAAVFWAMVRLSHGLDDHLVRGVVYSVNFWMGCVTGTLKPFPYTTPCSAAFCHPNLD